jgi:ATP-binding cassette subfamily F protein uup
MALNGYAGYTAAKAAPAKPKAAAAVTANDKAPAPAKAGGSKPRSASTLRRLIGVAERAMAEAEATRDRLAAELAAHDPADHVALTATAQALAEAEAALGAAEERWLELSEELGA